MAGDSRIISFSSGGNDETPVHGEFDPNSAASPESNGAEDRWDEAWTHDGQVDVENEAKSGSRPGLIAPVLAVLVAIGWTVFFLASQWQGLREGLTLVQAPALVMQWAVPIILICAVWLLALRHSAREARRFGNVARALSVESAQLERRLAAMNGELSLAREFITAQGRDLEALGRIASERLSASAEQLQHLVAQNGERVDTIGSVSSTALDNMEKLRGQLPVIASSAKDVASNIGNAGRTASGQLEELIAGLHRLNTFGAASERQVEAMRTAVDAAIEQFTGQCRDMEAQAERRFAALAQSGTEFRAELERHETEALAAIRTRAASLKGEIEQTQAQLDTHEAESLTSLRTRLASLRDESEIVSHALRSALSSLGDEQAATRQRIITEYEEALDRLGERVARFEQEARQTAGHVGSAQTDAISAFTASLATVKAEAEVSQASIDQQLNDFTAKLHDRQSRMAEQERHAVVRVSEMLGELDGAIAERLERHRHQAEALSERARSITGELEQFDARLRSIVTQSGDAQDRLLNALGSLTDNLTATRASLAATDGDVTKLTDDSLRLLELLQASAKQAHSSLPEAIAVSEDRIGRLDSGITAVLSQVERSAVEGERLQAGLAGSFAQLEAILERIEASQQTIGASGASHAETFAELADALEQIEQAVDRGAAKSRDELGQAIATLRGAIAEAIATIETEAPTRIEQVAGSLGDESGKSIEKAMRSKLAEISGQMEQALAHASGKSHETAAQLRGEIDSIATLVGNLEARLGEARDRAEERMDNDFTRRAALITESLNSSAIDIARAMSADVTDTAWASYLRGDRGIFTRRAVSLIDNAEARAIQQTYERDDNFRDHVNRYIHDFEAMLRQVLSTREGDAMGVTLLSSDMGKLYVALAQGIERLRT